MAKIDVDVAEELLEAGVITIEEVEEHVYEWLWHRCHHALDMVQREELRSDEPNMARVKAAKTGKAFVLKCLDPKAMRLARKGRL